MIRKRILWKVLDIVSISLLVIVCCSYFEDLFYGFYVLPHFRVQYIFVSIILILTLFFKRKEKKRGLIYIGLLLLMTIIQSKEVLNHFEKTDKYERTLNSNEPKLKIMLWNSWTKNTNHQEIYDFIVKNNPHIVLLQETHPSLSNKLQVGLASHHYYSVGDNLFFIKKEAQLKVDSFEEMHLTKVTGGNLYFSWNEEAISLLGIHLSAPISIKSIADRKHQIKDLEDWIKHQDRLQIVIGDLNTSPWSKEYKRLSKLLHDSMKGFGIQSTWPFHNGIISMLRIPLDHCFHSDKIITSNRIVEDSKGSNHKPLLLELQIKKKD